jgi:hypothetical protein
MKPCKQQKAAIALRATGDLSPDASRILALHLETCEGCRSYASELSWVCATHRSAPDLQPPAVHADDGFHRRLQQRIDSERARVWSMDLGLGVILRQLLRPGVAVGLACVLVFFLVSQRAPGPAASVPIATQAGQPSPVAIATVMDGPGADDPRLATYLAAVNQSFETFDDLLTRQSVRAGRASSVATFSALSRNEQSY